MPGVFPWQEGRGCGTPVAGGACWPLEGQAVELCSPLLRRVVLSTAAALEMCPVPLAVTVTWSWVSAAGSVTSW